MKYVFFHTGNPSGAYDYVDADYCSHYQYPPFPKTVITWSNNREENEELYSYQVKVWRSLHWHGGQSKHQGHYAWCLNRALRCGATMTIRQYAPGIDYNHGRRIRVLAIYARMVNTSDMHIIDPDYQIMGREMIQKVRRTNGLHPMDYRLILTPHSSEEDVRLICKDEWSDRFPPWNDPNDPLPAFTHTRESQVFWLHRLCQLSPGALTLEDGFKLYGIGLHGDNELCVAGCYQIHPGSLQLKNLSLDTIIHVSDPCRETYNIDKKYSALT